MKCPNCQAEDPTPPLSDNGTTTCPKCGHRFPVEELPLTPSFPTGRRTHHPLWVEKELAHPGG
jgi:hypothetical protein